jgi:hypothetical protein
MCIYYLNKRVSLLNNSNNNFYFNTTVNVLLSCLPNSRRYNLDYLYQKRFNNSICDHQILILMTVLTKIKLFRFM